MDHSTGRKVVCFLEGVKALQIVRHTCSNKSAGPVFCACSAVGGRLRMLPKPSITLKPSFLPYRYSKAFSIPTKINMKPKIPKFKHSRCCSSRRMWDKTHSLGPYLAIRPCKTRSPKNRQLGRVYTGQPPQQMGGGGGKESFALCLRRKTRIFAIFTSGNLHFNRTRNLHVFFMSMAKPGFCLYVHP